MSARNRKGPSFLNAALPASPIRLLQALGLAVTALSSGLGRASGAPLSSAGAATPDAAGTAVAAPVDEGATALPGIQVTGSSHAAEQDLPQAVDIIDQKELAEQAITRLQDALRNVPGITLNAGEGGAHGDSINLRGLSVPDSFFLDGLRDIGQYQRDTFNQDAVAVLLGPASVLFGRGSTAGVVNAISKQPELTPLEAASLAVGTAGLARATADFNWVLDQTTAARLTVMDERSGLAQRNDVENRRSGIAPSISFGIGTPTRLSLGLFHQEEDNTPDYGIPFVDGSPAPVNRTNYYGLLNYDRTSTDVNIFTARFDHDLTEDVTLTNTLRAAHYQFAYLLSAPHLDDDYTEPPAPGTPLADIRIYRDQPSSAGSESELINRTDLTSTFSTGGVGHTLITGIELSRETSDVDRYLNGIDLIAPTTLLNPNPYNAPATPLVVESRPQSQGTDVSLYAIDSIALSPKWDVDAGLRWDRFRSHFSDPLGGSSFARVDTEVSPRVALIYKPDRGQSYYASYGTSFNPAIEYLTLAPTSTSLAPERNRTIEIGTKIRLLDGKLGLTGALFRSDLTNARIADPDDPTIQEAPFDQRVRGIELGVAGYLTERWEVRASYTALNDVINSSTDPLAVMKDVPNVPNSAFNLWLTYETPGDWTLGTGLNFVGHRYADTHNTAGVPAFVVFNEMLAYRVDRNLSVQINLNNLTNRLYYSSLYYSAADENHAVPGPGRTLVLSASLRYD